jgi:cytochrome c5
MTTPIRTALLALLIFGVSFTTVWTQSSSRDQPAFDDTIAANTAAFVSQGRDIFRYDTFGSEAFWGDTLKLHQAIEGSRFGGVGAGVSPRTALAVGLKVDSQKLPNDLLSAIVQGRVDLNDPANTLALIKANAVVGVIAGPPTANGGLPNVGITCALCHSTVDDAIAPGIGRRRDGWPNRDLNVGAIAALSPDLSAVANLLGVDQSTVRTVLNSWGAGKFDAELFMDGKAFRPDGKTAATLIPPAFGLAGVNLHTYTGWGSVPYWNAFVANLEMHGSGSFFDPRLNDPQQFPVAAKAGFANVRANADNVTSKLSALHFYQLAIPAPAAPQDSFDARAAQDGEALFKGSAKCSTCHVAPLFTEPGWQMHSGDEIGIDNFQADRSPDHKYRTTPLKGLWAHAKGGYYHDGRYATLADVVQHYNQTFNLRLSQVEINNLVEYLKSL